MNSLLSGVEGFFADKLTLKISLPQELNKWWGVANCWADISGKLAGKLAKNLDGRVEAVVGTGKAAKGATYGAVAGVVASLLPRVFIIPVAAALGALYHVHQ